MRRDKINYYLDIAEAVLERGTCLRRNYGAVIVKNDQIIATGYVALREAGKLLRPRGVHARKASIRAARDTRCAARSMPSRTQLSRRRKEEMIGATLHRRHYQSYR